MNLCEKFSSKLGFEKKEVIGLDIGSSRVKLIQLRKDNGGYAVTAAGITEIAASEGNNNRQKINTVSAIRQCLELTAVKTEFAVCGVSGPEVAVRDFEFPPLPPEEVEAAVSFEASQVCPFNAADSAVDHQLIPNGDDKTRGILVAATNSLIRSKVQLAKEAYLKCVLMDVDGLALLNCFNGLHGGYEKPQAGRPIAILNVGGSCTTLAIMGDNGWPFIRDMTYAGDDIVEQLATEGDMSTKAVKGILSRPSTNCSFGTENNELSVCTISAGKKACQKLIVDVAETLRYYMAQEKSAPVDKILVCGGFAPSKGFVELLNVRLPVEAVLWNPFDDKIRCDAGQLCKDTLANAGPAMAVAAGLAMRSI